MNNGNKHRNSIPISRKQSSSKPSTKRQRRSWNGEDIPFTQFTEENGEDIPFTFVHKSSINISNASILSPTSKLVYKQWRIDANDELLIDGYFRECNVTKVHLPSDIKQIIASYYVKLHSKSKLNQIYETKRKEIIAIKKRETLRRQRRKEQRAKRNQNCIALFESIGYTILKLLIALLVLVVVCSVDIAGLIITTQNDCNSSINGIDINTFLLVGCSVHIICSTVILFTLLSPSRNELILTSVCCGGLLLIFVFVWSIIGFTLLDNDSVMLNKQCSAMLTAWSSINFMSVFFISCFGLCNLFI